MMISSAKYNGFGSVIAVIDDVRMTIPDEASNPYRQIVAKWEAEGNTITPYTAPPPTNSDVNAERERRIAVGTTINVTDAGDIPIQGREIDVRNMQGLGMAAFARMSSGDTTTITTFHDAVNVDHELTPSQMFELWQKSAAYAQAVYAASWTIKAMDPIPADYADNKHWPSSAA